VPNPHEDAAPAVEVPTDPDAGVSRRVCGCGHGRRHIMVSPVPTYTGWAKFWVFFMGVSAIPIRLDYRCRVCRMTFDSSEDPVDLNDYL
jgi:hypothetical protein